MKDLGTWPPLGATPPGLSQAVGDLAAELRWASKGLRRVRSEQSQEKWERLEQQRVDEELRARALAESRKAAALREKAKELEALIAQETASLEALKARGGADAAAREAEAKAALAVAQQEALQMQERLRERRERLEFRLLHEDSVPAHLPELEIGARAPAARQPPPALLTAHGVAEAAAALEISLGDALGEEVGHWLRMLRQALSALLELQTMAPSVAPTMPPSLWAPPNAPSAFEAGSVAFVGRLIALARQTGASAASEHASREKDLKEAIAKEEAAVCDLESQLSAAMTEAGRLTEELARARACRIEVEAEQAQFLPFAAAELEQVMGRLAEGRGVPDSLRRLAAAAGERLARKRHGHKTAEVKPVPWRLGRGTSGRFATASAR